jgi:arylsulfatase A-like enzyme
LAFADEVMTQERLGQRGVTDLLTVSFSSNDSVGHTYGPDSPQVRDISIRTDRVIGQLLDRADTLVGLEHTLIAFTSDHGVVPMPETRTHEAQPGGRMLQEELFGPIERALAKRFGDQKWVLTTAGSSPYLNYDLITRMGLDQTQVRRAAAEAARAIPHVARVYTRDELLQKRVPDDVISRRILKSFNARRSGDLEIVLDPYWMRNQPTGSTHGTPYEYDSHIPLILMGPGIKAGEYKNPVILNDLAPTLATLAGIGIPAKAAGRVLKEVLR